MTGIRQLVFGEYRVQLKREITTCHSLPYTVYQSQNSKYTITDVLNIVRHTYNYPSCLDNEELLANIIYHIRTLFFTKPHPVIKAIMEIKQLTQRCRKSLLSA